MLGGNGTPDIITLREQVRFTWENRRRKTLMSGTGRGGDVRLEKIPIGIVL
jgi:hypothetical protein